MTAVPTAAYAQQAGTAATSRVRQAAALEVRSLDDDERATIDARMPSVVKETNDAIDNDAIDTGVEYDTEYGTRTVRSWVIDAQDIVDAATDDLRELEAEIG
ncbi:MAG: hypothetical protein H7Z43_00525, partial [Clostridia bacterium]|nr:hypothetical protein [Deltaproteobacteria bacterium]